MYNITMIGEVLARTTPHKPGREFRLYFFPKQPLRYFFLLREKHLPMKRNLLLSICFLVGQVFSQNNPYADVFKAALHSPGIKTYLPRNSQNQICLEAIFTNSKLPGNIHFLFEGREVAMLSEPQPEELSVCQAGLMKFKLGKRKAQIKLMIGEQIQLKFVLKKVDDRWYPHWLYTKSYVPIGNEIEVQRAVEKYSY